MVSILRRLAGLSVSPPAYPIQDSKPDKQTADVANAAQRVNEKTDQVRIILAEMLKRTDGNRRFN